MSSIVHVLESGEYGLVPVFKEVIFKWPVILPPYLQILKSCWYCKASPHPWNFCLNFSPFQKKIKKFRSAFPLLIFQSTLMVSICISYNIQYIAFCYNRFCYIQHIYFQVSFLDFKVLEYWNLILFTLYSSNKWNDVSNEQYHFLEGLLRICGYIFVHHSDWR